MIAQISGQILEKGTQSILLENNGICYEVFLPLITLERINEYIYAENRIRLITYHYYHVEQSRSIPVLIGFLSKLEKSFFEEFIKVSGIGPKAALRALNTSISSIAKAIDDSDVDALRALPGIGNQRAKEIIAKLQGKIARFGLIQDKNTRCPISMEQKNLQEEAVAILMQLQYKKSEAKEMVRGAFAKEPEIKNIETLLNLVYKTKHR